MSSRSLAGQPFVGWRQVPLDQRVAEFPLAAHEQEAIPLKRGLACPGRPQLLPLTDECSDPLL